MAGTALKVAAQLTQRVQQQPPIDSVHKADGPDQETCGMVTYKEIPSTRAERVDRLKIDTEGLDKRVRQVEVTR